MLGVVGHVPRVSHVTGIYTQLWGDNVIGVTPTQTLEGTRPPVPNRSTPLEYTTVSL